MGRTLTEALVLSFEECKKQFEHERWNCSINHQAHRLNLIRNGLKESSFLFALSSAALTTSIARSCSSGILNESCSCDTSSFSDEVNEATWRWGGCGDNMKFSQMFLKSFLRYPPRHTSSDFPTAVDRHNSDLGIRTVKKNYVKKCKCHGVSGACETNTCWKQIKPFKDIGNDLKMKYERALKVSTDNAANSGSVELVTSSKRGGGAAPSKGQMIFRNKSPDFCSRDQYSPGTAARECNRTATCDSICCGRGYNIREVTLTEKCRCTFEWCCVVHCHICTRNVEVAFCQD
uniref:Protein Wnt n=1 Tax=Eupentacta fraudatrix TaxID=1774088 RepID=A0A5B9K393_9ECHN|nr:Wnt9 protein [Eupentacta fraudatrix]